jgi:hypothetical protein
MLVLSLPLPCPYAKNSAMTDTPPPPEDFGSLYRRAFAAYGAQALWNKRMLEQPTQEDALVIARALRIEGDREARKLAEQIEKACRAAL